VRSVAIVGEFCSGKTTLADYLVERYGYTRVSFARRLKEVAAAVYNNGAPIEKNGMYEVVDPRIGVNELSGRIILQVLGQSVKALDEHFWIRWLLADIEAGVYGEGPFVSDDTRFPYEAIALRQRGFAIVRLQTPRDVRMQRYEELYGRKPTQAEMNHPSEVESRNIEADSVMDGTRSVDKLADAIVRNGDLLAA
jgi:hypothetical protein